VEHATYCRITRYASFQGCVFRRTINRNVPTAAAAAAAAAATAAAAAAAAADCVNRHGPSQQKVYVACGGNDDDPKGCRAHDSQVCGLQFGGWGIVFGVWRSGFGVWVFEFEVWVGAFYDLQYGGS